MSAVDDGAWIRTTTYPLRSLDPDDADDSDLEPLRRIVGDVRVVSIGESMHQAREFYLLRHRLARFLIRDLGFTAFVMESGFPEGLGVNEWVHGGVGDLEDISRTGITYGFGKSEEVQAQLGWLRRWNSTHSRKVSFYGMDVPGSCVTARPAIEACLQRLKPRPSDEVLLQLSDLGQRLGQADARYRAMSPADRERLSAGIAALIDRATTSGDEIAYRCSVCARSLDDYIKGDRQPRSGWNPRDELMADNIQWILGRHERIVIGAHNGHVRRGAHMDWTTMGGSLGRALGNDMLVIGTTHASDGAPPHTLEALMESASLSLHMLDLRRVPPERLAGANSMLFSHKPIAVDPREDFDVLIHVRHVTPVAGEPAPEF